LEKKVEKAAKAFVF